jgi:hypothetical protein
LLINFYTYFEFRFISQISQLDPLEDEQIEIHAKMLKAKYLNKKYFFNKNGPIDEETQNIVYEFHLVY